jgi:hypothetical protein
LSRQSDDGPHDVREREGVARDPFPPVGDAPVEVGHGLDDLGRRGAHHVGGADVVTGGGLFPDLGVVGGDQTGMANGEGAPLHQLHDLDVMGAGDLLLELGGAEIAVGMRAIEDRDLRQGVDGGDLPVDFAAQARGGEVGAPLPHAVDVFADRHAVHVHAALGVIDERRHDGWIEPLGLDRGAAGVARHHLAPRCALHPEAHVVGVIVLHRGRQDDDVVTEVGRALLGQRHAHLLGTDGQAEMVDLEPCLAGADLAVAVRIGQRRIGGGDVVPDRAVCHQSVPRIDFITRVRSAVGSALKLWVRQPT